MKNGSDACGFYREDYAGLFDNDFFKTAKCIAFLRKFHIYLNCA
jgi:hypothetical protein